MDKVTLTKRHLRREQWKSIIVSCQSSGMTVKAWCRQNNVCQQTHPEIYSFDHKGMA